MHLSYFFEPAILDGEDVFVKWSLTRKVNKNGVEINLSPTDILNYSKTKSLRQKIVVEYDKNASTNHIKSVRMSTLERRSGAVYIKVFFSGFPDAPIVFEEETKKSKKSKK